MPGPGMYEHPSSIGKGPAFQMRGKPSPDRDNGHPGPGNYNANYDALKERPPSAHLGKSKRDFLSKPDDKPGPGFYDSPNPKKGPSYTINGKPADRQDNDRPGPGHYELDQNAVRNRSPSANFSHSPARQGSGSRSASPNRDYNIGAGQYDPLQTYDARDYNLSQGKSSAQYSVPKADKPKGDNKNPGPGHYKIPVKFADVPKYSMPNQSQEFKWI